MQLQAITMELDIWTLIPIKFYKTYTPPLDFINPDWYEAITAFQGFAVKVKDLFKIIQ